jgi:hypothetical protein
MPFDPGFHLLSVTRWTLAGQAVKLRQEKDLPDIGAGAGVFLRV